MEIEWKAPFFLIIGKYNVFHSYEKNNTIIRVDKNGVFYQGNSQSSTKYSTYLSKPLDSIDISLEIRNITLDDAGYYNNGITLAEAQSGGEVVLIVYGMH